MRKRAKTKANQPKASWQRELLQPLLISLAPVAYMISQLDLPGEYAFLLVTFLMIGTCFLPLLIPEQMVGGSKLHRPSPPQDASDKITISPLQRISNGDYGPKIRDDYEGRLPLPEIDTVPPWVQWLIATFGALGPLEKLPQMLRFIIGILMFVAAFSAYAALIWWSTATALPLHVGLFTLLVLSALTFAGAYRGAFRRLHDIYTADAVKTGRHAFPALRR